ncbi:Uncharacterised protein [Mycobacterium tuberculosis]|nr:Uncharacterised protein [Mycobacterium tuberculosis]
MGTAILRCATPVRHAVRKAVHGLCIGSPRSCCTANAYRDITIDNDVSSPCGRLCSAAEATLPILARAGRSTTMVLVAGQ